MTTLFALFVSVGVLAGVATWFFLFVGPILIWAAFVAWACFFHSGGNEDALKSTVYSNLFGVLAAWIAAIIILAIPAAGSITLPVWAGIVVAVTVGGYILAAHVKALSSIPRNDVRLRLHLRFLLQTPDKLSLDNLLSLSLDNALFVVWVSMIIGAGFAYASGRLAGVLTKSEEAG